MEEMVEPDRTIMIVSIIGIVIIWGSFFYHKFVQGGATDSGQSDPGVEDDGEQSTPEGIAAGKGDSSAVDKPAKPNSRKKGKRRKKR
jgi:hypothetical protein